jgi:predicted anti-sigma-YlaC factor YlaD
MSRMHRLRRRHASASAAAHAHARELAADRLGSPLIEIDESWLDLHLADCAACRSIATAYEGDRLALRGLRDHQPEAPRDLWARTAAALEREAAIAAGARRGPASGRSWRTGPLVGVASGVAVIALVIGVSALSGAFTRVPTTANVPVASTPPVAMLRA